MMEPRRSANTGPSVRVLTCADFGMPDGSMPPGAVYTNHTPRRRLTLEEAERGDLPKPFSKDEWAAMRIASCAPAPNRT